MAFLWGSSVQQQEFDQLLDKCTSDLLPSNEPLDLPSALTLSDHLRSAAVSPSSALPSLLKRLNHSNPNVQLLALQLADVLLKNGGTSFLALLAKPAAQGGAATDLELIAAGRKAGGVNREVGQETRRLLQEWAEAFKASGKKELEGSELVEVYERLRREPGVEFPKLDRGASKAMVESLSAPDWLDSAYCTRCRTPFSTFNRKHHCRNCGQVFDQACSSSVAPLPHYGITEAVRVCDACSRKIKEGKGASVAKELEEERAKNPPPTAAGGTTGAAGAVGGAAGASKSQEDADLAAAIAASLADSASSVPRSTSTSDGATIPSLPTPGYNPSYASTISSQSDKKSSASTSVAAAGGGGEEEDPDLAAAIAASLRDLAVPASAPYLARSSSSSSTLNGEALTYSQLFPRQPSSSSYPTSSDPYSSHQPAPPQPPTKRFTLPSHDLPAHSLSQLSQFAAAGAQPGPYFAQQGRGDYEALRGGLEEGLVGSVGDAGRRLGLLREMEWKISEAARVYGAGLVERASYRPSPSLTSAHLPAQHNPYAQPLTQQAPPQQSQQPLDAHYRPHPVSSLSYGQPLPSYAVPQAPQAPPPRSESVPPTPTALSAQAESFQPQQTPSQPVPAGFYKPSSFPTVPHHALPTSLQTLPAAPMGEFGAEQQRERREEKREVEEAELISF